MSLPLSILCVVDDSMQPAAAERRAVELARRCGARVHFLMIAFDLRIDAAAELVDPEVSRLARERFVEERRGWLAERTASLASQRLRATCEVLWVRSEHDGVLATIAARQPDLVVKDLRRDTVLRRWTAVRSSDMRLARLCPVPLMLVQEDAGPLFERVTAAVDPVHPESAHTHLDERVVAAAMPMAMLAGAALQLVHVLPRVRQGHALTREIERIVQRSIRDDADAFMRFADRCGVPREQCIAREGDTVVELLRHIDAGAGHLLVLGSQYRVGLDRLLLGSHAEALVAQAPCDLLIVRPEGFAAELARRRVVPPAEGPAPA